MPESSKNVFLLFVKYAEMVNTHISDLTYRVAVAEATLQANQLLEAYNSAKRHTKPIESPGPARQLDAIRQAIGRLPE